MVTLVRFVDVSVLTLPFLIRRLGGVQVGGVSPFVGQGKGRCPLSGDPVVVVGYGDSITLAKRQEPQNRWLTLLKVHLERAFPARVFEIINSGAGGNTSREGLARIERDVLDRHPDWVLVEFGGNDATPVKERHVSFEEYDRNLHAILTRIREATNARVVLLTFPPIIDEWHAFGSRDAFNEWDGPDAYVEEYRKITRRFAEHHGLILADIDKDLRKVEQTEGRGTCILRDGVHLTARGNAVVAEAVFAVLKTELQAG